MFLYLKAELKGTFIPSDDTFGKERNIRLIEYFDLFDIDDEKEVLDILGNNMIDKRNIVSCNHKESYKKYRKYYKRDYFEDGFHLKQLKEFIEKYSKLGYKIIWYAQ